MCPRSFLCEEGNIKQHTSLNEKLCEIGKDAIWEFRFTCFLFYLIFVLLCKAISGGPGKEGRSARYLLTDRQNGRHRYPQRIWAAAR